MYAESVYIGIRKAFGYRGEQLESISAAQIGLSTQSLPVPLATRADF